MTNDTREPFISDTYRGHQIATLKHGGAWLVYLAGPWSIPPAFVVLPFAVSFAVALAVSIGSFKKYL